MPSRLRVDVTGPAVPRLSRRAITTFVATALRNLDRAGVAKQPIDEVSVVFVNDAVIRTLNRKYRGLNRPTDVLTFPHDDGESEPGSGVRPLGEIVISLDQARRQARDERHSLAREVRYLLLHGIIHALGYDHETDRGEMDALEMAVRARVGLV